MFRLIALAAVAASLVAPGVAWGHRICVGGARACHATIRSAVAAAHDGDVIRIGRGTFRGSITIAKSLRLVGRGAGVTTIRGGGPVITIGRFLARRQPTVSIAGVTITGGITHTSGMSRKWTGHSKVIAAGGGIEINPGHGLSTGATVRISRSVISGNRAEPTMTRPVGPACPGGPCPFAGAWGGGIDSWGRLTLTHTTVSGNTAAGVASDADGGGIDTHTHGALTLRRSRVIGNRAVVTAPNGRFAEGGGVFTDPKARLTIVGSSVSRNHASLTSRLPYFVKGKKPIDMNAHGGAVHVGDGTPVVIRHARLNGNLVTVDDPNGQPVAFDAAMNPGAGSLTLIDTAITGNHLVARVGSSSDAGPSGSALDIIGPATLSRVRITNNTMRVESQTGEAAVNGAVYAGDTASTAVIEDSVIGDNTTVATSATGSAAVKGGGLVNDGRLLLRRDRITGNTATATAPAGSALGGGVWNGAQYSKPPIRLALDRTTVERNALHASPGVVVMGGGLFTAFPVMLARSVIAENSPDQCSGCRARRRAAHARK